MEGNGQLHTLATLPPRNVPPVPTGYEGPKVSLDPVENIQVLLTTNRIPIPQLSSPYSSHYSD
jgi:hypothetical protein